MALQREISFYVSMCNDVACTGAFTCSVALQLGAYDAAGRNNML